MPLPWFDAHLDLAYLAVNGRDMLAPLDPAAGPHPPAAVTLPALVTGHVRLALATIYTEPLLADAPPATEAQQYRVGEWDRAHAVGRAQLEVYLTWRDLGHVAIDLPRVFRADPGVGQVRGGMGVAELVPPTLDERLAKAAPGAGLHIGILMENADPIRSPDELAWWKDRGVCAIGLAWARSSRYAGGNTTTDGLTPAGRDLVREMDRLGVVHDIAHLSDRALDDLLHATDRRVMASHSNCRALLDGTNQRHLTDETIREIARRGGVIGLNLYSRFLCKDQAPDARASLDDCIRHLEHIRDLTGQSRCIGLGSDMDGGFSAAALPIGIDRPADLGKLADALSARGWTDDDIAGFAWKNWARFWATQGT